MKHDWEYKKLGEVCDVSAGQGAPQGEQSYCENGTPFIKAGNLEDLVNGLDEGYVQNVSQAIAQKHKLKLYKAGSVLFAKSGMSCMKGYVHVLQRDCYVVSHLAILTPKTIEGHFLKYYLRFTKTYSLVKDEAYPSISLSDIASFPVPIPPLPIQEQIVAELDKVSEIIEKKKQQVKELDTLAQSIFYDMFGDPVENEMGWEVKTIGDVAELNKGITYSPNDVVNEGGTIVLRSGNIQGSSFDLADIVRIKKKINPSKFVHKNEILMCNRNGSPNLVGKVAKIPQLKEPMTFGTFMTVIISDMYEYLFAFFKTAYFREQIRFSTAIAINQISLPLLASVKIPIPPLPLQQSFAQKVEAIEKQKELITASIKEAQLLFDARMDYWFGE